MRRITLRTSEECEANAPYAPPPILRAQPAIANQKSHHTHRHLLPSVASHRLTTETPDARPKKTPHLVWGEVRRRRQKICTPLRGSGRWSLHVFRARRVPWERFREDVQVSGGKRGPSPRVLKNVVLAPFVAVRSAGAELDQEGERLPNRAQPPVDALAISMLF